MEDGEASRSVLECGMTAHRVFNRRLWLAQVGPPLQAAALLCRGWTGSEPQCLETATETARIAFWKSPAGSSSSGREKKKGPSWAEMEAAVPAAPCQSSRGAQCCRTAAGERSWRVLLT